MTSPNSPSTQPDPIKGDELNKILNKVTWGDYQHKYGWGIGITNRPEIVKLINQYCQKREVEARKNEVKEFSNVTSQKAYEFARPDYDEETEAAWRSLVHQYIQDRIVTLNKEATDGGEK